MSIIGNKERDINQIQPTAYKQVQDIQGEADAKATEIYANAYTQKPEAAVLQVFEDYEHLPQSHQQRSHDRIVD